MRKIYCIVCDKHRKFKSPKISYIFKKILSLGIFCNKCGNEYKKTYKEEESIEILKSFVLITNMEEY